MPSSDFRLSLPISPLRRAKVVFAAVTPKLRKHSRVWLYTQYFRLSIYPPTLSESLANGCNLVVQHYLKPDRSKQRISSTLWSMNSRCTARMRVSRFQSRTEAKPDAQFRTTQLVGGPWQKPKYCKRSSGSEDPGSRRQCFNG